MSGPLTEEKPEMSEARKEPAGKAFTDVWTAKICPAIQHDYAELLETPPSRLAANIAKKLEKKEKKEETKGEKEPKDDQDDQDDEDGTASRLQEIVETVRAKTEKRNCYMSLAWTGPVQNTPLQANIPYYKVAHMAVDMFCDASDAAKAVSTEGSPAQTVTSEAGEEGASGPQARLSVVEVILS